MSELQDKARALHKALAAGNYTAAADTIRDLLAENERLKTEDKRADIRHTNTLIQRDHAEAVIDRLCDAVLGVAPEHRQEWSNAYTFNDAAEAIEEKIERMQRDLAERQAHWRDAVSRAEAAEARLRELES